MGNYDREYLELLSEKYPDEAAVCSEIINLRAILALPMGTEHFISDLHAHGVKTAVVTSSNQMKMSAVYKVHPRFKEYFDAILTAEDFAHSKPHPDCYLKGAARFGASPEECVVFEDSFNGLKSGRAANMKVIGLTTSNSAEAISSLSDWQMSDFQGLDYQKMCALLA